MNKRFAATVNLFFNSAAALFTAVTGFVMVPIYLRSFNVATYGAWLASGNIVSLLSMFESGLSTVVTQRMAAAYATRRLSEFSEIAASGLALSCVLGGAVFSLGAGFCLFVPNWVHTPADQRHALSLAILFAAAGAGLSIIFLSLGAIAQAWQLTVVPGFIGLAALSGNIIAILLALHHGWGVVSLGVGSFCLSCVYIVGYLAYLIPTWRRLELPPLRFSGKTFVMLLHEAKVLLLARISGTLGANVEPAIAAIFINPQSSAVLVLTGRVVTVAQMFLDRLGSAVFAGMANVASSGEIEARRSAVREVMTIQMVFSGIALGMALAFTKPILILWLGAAMFGGKWLLALICVSAMMTSRKLLASNLTIAFGEIRRTSIYLVAESVLRLVLIMALAYMLKLVGIPLAGAIASATLAFILSMLLVPLLKGSARDVLQPGLAGFIQAGALGLFWLLVIPEAKSWSGLMLQGTICGCVMTIAVFLVDRPFAATVRKSVRSIGTALSTRYSGFKPALNVEGNGSE